MTLLGKTVASSRRRARRTLRGALAEPNGLSLSAVIADLCVITLAAALAAIGRVALPYWGESGDISGTISDSWLFIVGGWLGILAASGAYDESYFGGGTEEYRLVLNSSVITAAVVGIGCYLAQFPLPRAFFVLLFAIGVPALLLERYLLRKLLQRARRRGRLVQRTLVAGGISHIEDIVAVLRRESWLGYSVVGCLSSEKLGPETRSGIPVLGRPGEAAAVVEQHAVDVILFAGGAFESAAELRKAAWELETRPGLQIVVAPSLTDVSSERISVRPVAGLPLVHLDRPRSRDASHWAKRAFDIVGALAIGLALLVPMLVLALWIRLNDRGPSLYSQVRVGRDGEEFRCYKFRSMVVDADKRSDILAAGDQDHVLFKMQKDPRITRPGAFIRRFSLDELPQLLNVVRGDMSLVGPRPALPVEVSRYSPDVQRRLNVRPGMTGLWQVSGRSDLSWDDTVRLDLYYVDNWSMVQDLTILLRTVGAVVAARGAY